MTKNELIGLININMMNCLRNRDKTDPSNFPEQYGYHNGQFRAYEDVIKMLTTFDIEELDVIDCRVMQ